MTPNHYQLNTKVFLDMECLAMLGWTLSEWLKQRAV